MFRLCQRHTHGLDLPVARQIALTVSPSALSKTMCARQITFAGVLRSAIRFASRVRSSEVTVMSVFMRRACMICPAMGIHRQRRNTSILVLLKY